MIGLVATLALGSRPRQGFTRMWAKRGARECGRVWEWTLTLPNELPFWELESQWTLETSENDCKGQNPSPWEVFYTIRKLLKRKCPKWARMTHLDICNTSYGQKKGQESNSQFDSRPQKSRESTWFPCVQVVRDTSLESSQWGLQLCFRSRPNQRSTPEVIVSQNCKIPSLGDFGTPGTKNHLDATPTEWCKVYYIGVSHTDTTMCGSLNF